MEHAGTFWYAVRPLVFISLPYERVIRLTSTDHLRMFCTGPALVLRYPASEPGTQGTGGVYVCEHKGYDLCSLHAKARNQTRKGLRECTVQRIGFDTLVEFGFVLNAQTSQRQGRGETALSKKRWKRYCEAAGNTPGMESWGAFVGERLAAFVVCATVERSYNILYQSSNLELLTHCPNNALAFTVTKRALEQAGIDRVCYGLKSVEQTSGLEHFKCGIGFSLSPMDERLVLHPVLRLCLALGGRRGIEWSAARRPGSDFWRKALAVCQRRDRSASLQDHRHTDYGTAAPLATD